MQNRGEYKMSAFVFTNEKVQSRTTKSKKGVSKRNQQTQTNIENQGRTNRRNAARTSVDRITEDTLALTIAGCNKVVYNGFIKAET